MSLIETNYYDKKEQEGKKQRLEDIPSFYTGETFNVAYWQQEIKSKQCPKCQSKKLQLIYKDHEPSNFKVDEWTFFRCLDCQHIDEAKVLLPRPEVKEAPKVEKTFLDTLKEKIGL